MRVWCAGLLLALLACGGEPPPHIVLIVGDDLSYGDYGFMGSAVAHTPNLDRLAAEGTVFREAFTTSSLCRPSLLSLLTGLDPLQYTWRLQQLEAGGQRVSADTAMRAVATLPRLLAERGYASFQAGKYFEGDPTAAGFSAGMVSTESSEGHGLLREGLDPVLRFLDERGEEPFFLWFAPLLPHLPHDAPKRFYQLHGEAPPPRATQRYFANVARFDEGVGRLVEALGERGLLEDTLLVYLADNGWQAGPVEGPHLYGVGGPRGKNSLHGEGFRTPLLLRWPGRVPAGRSSDALVSALDLLPTLLDYAGVSPPPGLDGRSLRPAIEGRGSPGREAIVAHMPTIRRDTPQGELLEPIAPGRTHAAGGFFVRTPRWHYVAYRDPRRGEELYDLAADPGEQSDVARSHPEVLRELRGRLRRWHEHLRRLAS